MSKKPKRSPNPPGKCIFCGGGDLSKAHIFPKWLGGFITEKTDKHVEGIGRFETFTAQTRTPEPWLKVWQGDTGSKRLKKVCRSCNSGWLGGFETPAKPHVISLMNGNDIIIDAVMQRQMAVWLCAITMLVDAADPPGSAVPQVHRDYFKARGEPPPMWRIWLGRYSGRDWQVHRVRRTGMTALLTPEINGDRFACNTQVTTLVIRQLCAHIFSSTVFDLPGYEGIALQQIWPLTGKTFVWTHAPVLNDTALVTLAEALARDLKPIP